MEIFGALRSGTLFSQSGGADSKTFPQVTIDFDPKVFYKDYPKTFIAGSVVYGDVNDCAEDAKVTLTDKSTNAKTDMKANFFGDFMFDGLSSGKYSVKIDAAGYASKTIEIDLKADTYLGAIALAKK